MILKNCCRNNLETDDKRPELDKNLKAQDFLKWYYLKEELIAFCKDNAIPCNGNKKELSERIFMFLKEGKIAEAARRNNKRVDKTEELSLDRKIEADFVCSQRHREFFKQHLGKSFSFNVTFQNWLKNNAGKTYADALEVYKQIKKEYKTKKKDIAPQFEYNSYIRAFFADNPDRTLAEAINCWKYKKSQPGDHRYEPDDLKILSSSQ